MLDIAFVVAIVTAFVVSPFFAVSWIRYSLRRKEDRVFPLKSTVVFIVPVIVGLLSGFSSQSVAQLEVLHFLDSPLDTSTVSVDGRQVQNRDEILNTLRELKDLPDHHSSPTKRITVEISDHSRLVLSLARDSNNPREYWVFYPQYFITRSNEIGRVITPIFDAY